MDIRKLQRVIVDGLEDVKGHNIAVFNTEHLSPLFERVIIASGTSNRQTKALAASVRDAVKSSGFDVLRTEGETNGEWIIVDCGAAVVHLMQPTIREYYHLEEIWGDKPVKMKLDTSPKRLVKAESDDDETESTPAARRKPAAKKPAGKAVAKPVAQPPVKAAATKPAAKKAAAEKVAPKAAAPAAPRTRPTASAVAPRQAAPRKTASAKTPRKAAGVVTRTVGVKRTPAAKKVGRKA